MTDRELPPTSPTENIWPPPPLRDAEPTSTFLAVEGIEVSQSGGRLVLINKSIRRLLLVEVFIFLFSFSSPWITFWTSPFHRHVLPHMLPYVFSIYRHTYIAFLFVLLVVALIWCLFYFHLSLGIATLNNQNATARANGRVRPLGKIESIRIMQYQNPLFGLQYIVNIVWNGGRPTSRWQKALINAGASISVLGALRNEENAEKVAAVIAEFAGVPVEYRTIGGNGV